MDRQIRSHIKTDSLLQGALIPHSRSTDDKKGTFQPRTRGMRSHRAEAKPGSTTLRRSQDLEGNNREEEDEEEEEEEGEEEVTRCVCGSQEYPGLPVISEPPKNQTKADGNPTTIPEDSTGWFIQCDKCKVWQHGGCVGIMDENTSPEEYFCEQCRRDLHDYLVTMNGRKYTIYLPLQDDRLDSSSPAIKVKANVVKPRDQRAGRTGVDNLVKGRRATMNSRDSAYDEFAQLQRAIEESKKDSGAAVAKFPSGGKRSRSESEDRSTNTKRQRTNLIISSSSSSKSKDKQVHRDSDEEPQDEIASKNIRGAAARNHRAKQVRERERATVRDTDVSEIAGKRNERREKRSTDDSEPSPEPVTRSNLLKAEKQTTDMTTLPVPPESIAVKTSQFRRSGRPPARRGRLGRNQWTKDREVNAVDIVANSPIRSQQSLETEPMVSAVSIGIQDNNSVGKPSKPRYMNPNRTSMNDMRKRVAGIIEFISHTQVEMAGLDMPVSKTPLSSKDKVYGTLDMTLNAHDPQDTVAVDKAAFDTLSSVQMMEVLTRSLMRWQKEYGKHGDK